jgi:hypothetical protein
VKGLDDDAPRTGGFIFEGQNPSEHLGGLTRRVDRQQDRRAAWIHCDGDAAVLCLKALPWRSDQLRTAITAKESQRQHPRFVDVSRPIRIVGKNFHRA